MFVAYFVLSIGQNAQSLLLTELHLAVELDKLTAR